MLTGIKAGRSEDKRLTGRACETVGMNGKLIYCFRKEEKGYTQCSKNCGPYNCVWAKTGTRMSGPNFFLISTVEESSQLKTCKQSFGINIFDYEGHDPWPNLIKLLGAYLDA